MLGRRKAVGALAVKRPTARLIALLVGLFAIVLAASRFDVLPVRGDTWILDRSSKHICTIGLEVMEPPCWPAFAAGLSRLGVVRPNGADWTVNASALRRVNARVATGPCYEAGVWYADDARNLFLSDGHAYAVDAPLPLPFRESVRVCDIPWRPGLYVLAQGHDAAPAVRMR